MTDASDVTPQQAGIYTAQPPEFDVADSVEVTQQEEDTYFANGALHRVTKIAIPRQYDEPTIPPMVIQTMQEDILRAIGLVPEHHVNDMAWSFHLDSPGGQKVVLARPVMSLTTTQEIWNKITAITGNMVFFWSPSERCMDVLILLTNPAKVTLRGYPIRENYHVLHLIDYVFYREPNWVPGFKFVFNEELPYFKPEFVLSEDKFDEREIPNLRELIAKREKEQRVTDQQTRLRVLNSLEERFPQMTNGIKALGSVLSLIDLIPGTRNELDRDKLYRTITAKKNALVGLLDEALWKRTLHISVDDKDPQPEVTAELICAQVRDYCKDLPEPIRSAMSKALPRGYDRSLAMPDELVSLRPDVSGISAKSILLGATLDPTDLDHMLKLERELFVGDGEGLKIDERSAESYYHFLHKVVRHQVDALDLEVVDDPAEVECPIVRIRRR